MALDFRPLDFQPEQPEQPTRKRRPSTGLDFRPLDFQLEESTPTPPTPTGPEFGPGRAEALEGEIENRSFFDRPALGAEFTRPAEVEAIAKKHGVDPERLLELSPYFGIRLEGTDGLDPEELRRAAGGVGQVLLGIPQKLYKIAQDPAMEKALDDVQRLAEGRQSWLQLGGEMLAPVGPVVRGATTAGKAIRTGALTGAAAGAAGSRQDQELEGATLGAAIGGVAGGVIQRIQRRAAGRTASRAEKETLERVSKESEVDIERGIEEVLSEMGEVAPEIRARVINHDVDLGLEDDLAENIARQTLGRDKYSTLMDPSSSEGSILARRARKELPDVVRDQGEAQAVRQLLARDVINENTVDFAGWLTRSGQTKPSTLEEASEVLSEYVNRQGGRRALDEVYNIYQREKAGEKWLAREAIRTGRDVNAGNRAIDYFSDAQFVLRSIDDLTGVDVEPIHRDLNTRINRMSFPRLRFRRDVHDIFRIARKSGVDREAVSGNKIYRALDTGNYSGLSSAEMRVAGEFRKYFDSVRDFVNDTAGALSREDPGVAPLSIPTLKNYIPHRLVRGAELESRVGKRLQGVDLRTYRDPGEYKKLLNSNSNIREVHELLSMVEGGSNLPTTGPELLARVHDTFRTQAGRNALETTATAALERGDVDLPMWARETNLYKLANDYAANTLRHLYLRGPIDGLTSKARLLRKAGAEAEADYITNLVADIQGTRRGTAAAYSKIIQEKYQRTLRRVVESLPEGSRRRKLVEPVAMAAEALPEIGADINQQIYPNFLGMSIRAVMMNSTQPIAKTLPEIGMTPYGMGVLNKAGLRVAGGIRYDRDGAMWMVGNTKIDSVLANGLAPAEYVKKYSRAVAEGIRRSTGYSIASQITQKSGETAMYFYTKMDLLNRAITQSAAEVIAEDLSKGSGAARRVLNEKFPRSLRRRIERIGVEDTDAVAKEIASHLNASTQYNYNRASLSEFGRTWGPFFSTFTKWPTATAGEIAAEYREKGAIRGTTRNLEKYLAPYILLKGMDAVIKGTMGDRDGEFTDRQKLILGSRGLAGSAPLGSVEPFIRGEIFTPPAIDVLLHSIIIPAMDGDVPSLRRGVIQSLQNFGPNSVWVKFITQDIPTFLTGHRPEGSNFLERTVEGTHTLNRELGK